MRKIVSFMMVAVVMLSMFGVASGAVLLDEQFNGDLSNWTLLDGGGITTATATGGKLNLTATNPAMYAYYGVESKVAYAVPTGPTGMLVVDFYGVNVTDKSAPTYFLSEYKSTSNLYQPWNNYIGVKGKDSYFADFVMWTGVSSQTYTTITPAIGNATTPRHMILTVDAANIKVYIADDYFENLVNPIAAYTTTTSSIFNSEWTGAVYVNLLLNENTSWYTGASTETFDGVKITSIPEPVSLILLGVGSITMLLRKKQ